MSMLDEVGLTEEQLACVMVFHCDCGCSYLQDERFKAVRRKPASIEMHHIDTHVRCYVPLSAFGRTVDEGDTSYVALKYHWKGLEPTQDAINTALQKRASWAKLELKEAEPLKEKRMSMSTHVVGFIPPDAEYKRKLKAFDACKAAGVEPPDELYFKGERPDDTGTEVDIEDTEAVTEYKTDSDAGFEVHLDKLPPGVKVVRFYNNW